MHLLSSVHLLKHLWRLPACAKTSDSFAVCVAYTQASPLIVVMLSQEFRPLCFPWCMIYMAHCWLAEGLYIRNASLLTKGAHESGTYETKKALLPFVHWTGWWLPALIRGCSRPYGFRSTYVDFCDTGWIGHGCRCPWADYMAICPSWWVCNVCVNANSSNYFAGAVLTLPLGVKHRLTYLLGGASVQSLICTHLCSTMFLFCFCSFHLYAED